VSRPNRLGPRCIIWRRGPISLLESSWRPSASRRGRGRRPREQEGKVRRKRVRGADQHGLGPGVAQQGRDVGVGAGARAGGEVLGALRADVADGNQLRRAKPARAGAWMWPTLSQPTRAVRIACTSVSPGILLVDAALQRPGLSHLVPAVHDAAPAAVAVFDRQAEDRVVTFETLVRTPGRPFGELPSVRCRRRAPGVSHEAPEPGFSEGAGYRAGAGSDFRPAPFTARTRYVCFSPGRAVMSRKRISGSGFSGVSW
jgi:hypothetical protein